MRRFLFPLFLVTSFISFAAFAFEERVERLDTSEGTVTVTRRIAEVDGVLIKEFTILRKDKRPIQFQSTVSSSQTAVIPLEQRENARVIVDQQASIHGREPINHLYYQSPSPRAPSGIEAQQRSLQDFRNFQRNLAALNRRQTLERDAINRSNREAARAFEEGLNAFKEKARAQSRDIISDIVELTSNLLRDQKDADGYQLLKELEVGQPELTSLFISSDQSLAIAESILQQPDQDHNSVAQRVADLFSPLNQAPSDLAQNLLTRGGVREGVLPGPLLREPSLQFQTAELEDQRLRIQNGLQAIGRQYPIPAQFALRSGQLWIKAARQAEAKGQIESAREILRHASSLPTARPSSELWSDQEYARSLMAYTEIEQPSAFDFQSQDAKFLNVANPVGGYLEQASITRLGEDRAIAKAGLHFLKHADQLSAAGDNESASQLLELAIGAVDVIAGVFPLSSLVKDGYEALTGQHLLTGAKLSDLDRGFAVAGFMTLGFGGVVVRGAKALSKISLFADLSQGAKQASREIASALRTAHVRSRLTLDWIRYRVSHHQTLANVTSAITDVHEDFMKRLASTRFGFRTLEFTTSFNLNRKAILNENFDAYARPGAPAVRVLTDHAPLQLVRASLPGKEAGEWFFHSDLLDDLLRKSSSSAELQGLLKSELNIDYLPTRLSRVKGSPDLFELEVSELKHLQGMGTNHKQLQFRVLSVTPQIDPSAPTVLPTGHGIKNVLNPNHIDSHDLEEVFRRGSL